MVATVFLEVLLAVLRFFGGYNLCKKGFKCSEWLKVLPCVVHTCLQNFRKIRHQTLELWPFENGWVNFRFLKSELQREKDKVCDHK